MSRIAILAAASTTALLALTGPAQASHVGDPATASDCDVTPAATVSGNPVDDPTAGVYEVGPVYVDNRGSLQHGRWVYLESNGTPGLQRGGVSPTGEVDYCSESASPDTVLAGARVRRDTDPSPCRSDSSDVTGVHSAAGTVYVDNRGFLLGDGAWIYLETNNVAGLQRGGTNLLGESDPCQESLNPDRLLF
jgi:hypothetical protein